MSKYILTESECVAKGGHIYETDYLASIGVTRARQNDIPTREHPDYKVCRYCGHRMRGYYPDMIWEDVK